MKLPIFAIKPDQINSAIYRELLQPMLDDRSATSRQ